jgi:hypothetical protein
MAVLRDGPLVLSDAERAGLERTVRHDKRPYFRERAAALLKIADGASARSVALYGLLIPRKPDTVYAWLHHYRERRQLVPRPACRGTLSPPVRAGRRTGGYSPPLPGGLWRSTQPLDAVSAVGALR